MLAAIREWLLFFFNDTATTEIYTLSLHDALPIYLNQRDGETTEYLLSLAEEHPGAETALRKVSGVIEVTKPAKAPQYRVTVRRKQTEPNLLLRAALDSGAQILGFQENVRHLNQAFMDLTEPGVSPVMMEDRIRVV